MEVWWRPSGALWSQADPMCALAGVILNLVRVIPCMAWEIPCMAKVSCVCPG